MRGLAALGLVGGVMYCCSTVAPGSLWVALIPVVSSVLWPWVMRLGVGAVWVLGHWSVFSLWVSGGSVALLTY